MPEDSDYASHSRNPSNRGSVASVVNQGSHTLHALERLSPTIDLQSPLSPITSYFGFQRALSASGDDALIPPSDDLVEERLLNGMQQCISSNDLNIQLDWAEEALRYCRLCLDFEVRVSKTQRTRKPTPEGETKLRQIASQVVEGAARAGNGRALFIKARHIEIDPHDITEYLERARRAGYHRSHYWIGQQCLVEKNKIALWHFETGVEYDDAACKYVINSF
jgi:hypothetical protein